MSSSAKAGETKKSVPFWKHVAAGGGAGIMEILCMYPTDVAKTRQQLSGGKTTPMIMILKDIIQNEGPTKLYRGVLSPVFAEAPKRALKFSLNETYKGALRKEDGSLPGFRAAAAGSMAGMSECSVNTPFEVVKVQMQAKENIGKFSGVADCAIQLVKTEGVFGLYKGIESHLWRNAVWNGCPIVEALKSRVQGGFKVFGALVMNGVYFGMIGTIKTAVLPSPPGASKSTKMGYDFISGVVGGTLATLANTPFDVVKSRMQVQPRVEGQVPKYNWTVPSLATVINEEGMGAAYKGIGPRLVRLGPGGGIMLVAFNYILDLLERY